MYSDFFQCIVMVAQGILFACISTSNLCYFMCHSPNIHAVNWHRHECLSSHFIMYSYKTHTLSYMWQPYGYRQNVFSEANDTVPYCICNYYYILYLCINTVSTVTVVATVLFINTVLYINMVVLYTVQFQSTCPVYLVINFMNDKPLTGQPATV